MTMDFTTRSHLARLWQKVLCTNPAQLFDSAADRLQNRSWGDSLAQPGYVGSGYNSGGLIFISMNPGVGRGVGLSADDLLQYEALRELRDAHAENLIEKFDRLMPVLQSVMPTWTIVKRFVEPILTETKFSFSNIAYFNLLKWRTTESNNLKNLYATCWRDHTAEQVRLLEPGVVIAIGVDAGKAFQRHYSGPALFDVIPRVIGNNIGEPGRQALRRIGGWLATHQFPAN